MKSIYLMMMAQQAGEPAIFTYTTNATAATITAWIGSAVSNNVIVPNTIEDLPVFVNSNSTFRANTAVEKVNIEDSTTWFVGGRMNDMSNAFNGCSVLTGVNAIPDSVTNMAFTFFTCSNLVNAPTIGANVTSMTYTFRYCSNLVNAPTIGANVTSMVHTFSDCSNLVNAPTIPDKVTSMVFTFFQCSNLVNAPSIPANVTNMAYTFRQCSRLVNAPSIPDKVTTMAYTFYLCSNLVNAPTIGANVVNHHSTFKDATNLAGNITLVNTSITEANMTNMFLNCNASIAKTLRCPSGSATYNSAINVVDGKNGVTVVAY